MEKKFTIDPQSHFPEIEKLSEVEKEAAFGLLQLILTKIDLDAQFEQRREHYLKALSDRGFEIQSISLSSLESVVRQL